MQIHKLLLILFCCSLPMSAQGADKSLIAFAGAGRSGAVATVSSAATGGSGEGILGVGAARDIQRLWRGYHVRAQQAWAIKAALRFFPWVEGKPSLSKVLGGVAEHAGAHPSEAMCAWGGIVTDCAGNEVVAKQCLDGIAKYAKEDPGEAIKSWANIARVFLRDEMLVNRCLDNIDRYGKEAPAYALYMWRNLARIFVRDKRIFNRCLDNIDRYAHAGDRTYAAIDAWANAAKAYASDEAVVNRCLGGIARYAKKDPDRAIDSWKDLAVACADNKAAVVKCFNGVLEHDATPSKNHVRDLVTQHLRHLATVPDRRMSLLKELLYDRSRPDGGLKGAGDDGYDERAHAIARLLSDKKVFRLSEAPTSDGKPSSEVIGRGGMAGRGAFMLLAPPLCHGAYNDDAARDCLICVYAKAHGIVYAPASAA